MKQKCWLLDRNVGRQNVSHCHISAPPLILDTLLYRKMLINTWVLFVYWWHFERRVCKDVTRLRNESFSKQDARWPGSFSVTHRFPSNVVHFSPSSESIQFNTCLYAMFCMGVKLGFSSLWKSTEWGCLRKGCLWDTSWLQGGVTGWTKKNVLRGFIKGTLNHIPRGRRNQREWD